MPFSLKGIKLNGAGKKLIGEMKRLVTESVDVGIADDAGGYDNGTSIAEVAAFQEFGTSRIPARPFLKQGLEKNTAKMLKLSAQGVGEICKGGSADDAFVIIGEGMAQAVKDEIDSGDFTPNAPSTVAKKGHNHPLIDTGAMKDAVSYKIRGAE